MCRPPKPNFENIFHYNDNQYKWYLKLYKDSLFQCDNFKNWPWNIASACFPEVFWHWLALDTHYRLNQIRTLCQCLPSPLLIEKIYKDPDVKSVSCNDKIWKIRTWIPGICWWVSMSLIWTKNKWMPRFSPWVISCAMTRQQLDVFPTVLQSLINLIRVCIV